MIGAITIKGLGKPHVIGLLAWLGVMALVVRWRFDAVLQATHLPGEPSYNLPLVVTPSSIDAIADAVRAWRSLEHVAGADIAIRAVAADALATGLLLAAVVLGLGALARRLDGGGDRGAIGRAAARARGFALAALALRLVGDLGVGLLIDDARDGKLSSSLDTTRAVLVGLEVSSAVLALVSIGIVAVAAVWAAMASRRDGGGLLRNLATVRVHLLVVAFFGVLVLAPIIGPQLDDVILRWEQEWGDAVIAAVAMLWLGGVLLVVTNHLLANDHFPQRSTAPWRLFVLAIVVGLAGCVVPGLLVLAGIVGALWFLSLFFKDFEAPPRLGRGGMRAPVADSLVPVVLAAGPISMLGIAVVRAAAGEAALEGGAFWLFVAGGVVIPPLIGAIIQWKVLRRGVWWVVGASAVVSLVIAAGLVVNPWRWGDLLGVVGTFACFAVILSLLGFAIAYADLRWRPPPILLVLGQRRLPIVAILVVWSVGVGMLLSEDGYHDIRDEPRASGTPGRVDVSGAFTEWLRRNELAGRRAGKPRKRRQGVPLVIVAAAGGGIRAAYWTARVVDCAIDQSAAAGCAGGERNAARVFVASGVSGGSLGLASWAAHRVQGGHAPGTVWVDKRLGEDYFAPAWARALFSDLPASLLRIGSGPDRGTVLERAWEQSWTRRQTDWRSLFRRPQPSTGPLTQRMLALPRRVKDLPLLMFSGTSVTDGCRTNTSRLRGAALPEGAAGCTSPEPTAGEAGDRALARRATFGATRDIFDICQKRDVRLSTAALLSARFPVISPAGRVACGDGEQPQVVDGAYYDNTAASPVQELWARLAPLVAAHNRRAVDRCIVPVMLQIDNAYVGTAPPARARPRELLAPLTALVNTRSAREAGAEQAAAVPFRRARLEDGSTARAPRAAKTASTALQRYVHVFPRVQPGAQAPLGWTLSEPSRTSLADEVESGPNRAGLRQVRRWFADGLRCTR